MREYNFCPKCGKPIAKGSEPPKCEHCNITYYTNAKPTASVLPVKDSKVLLAIRGREPNTGAYDVIGGFMEADELPEEAALREAKEETNLDMKIVELLGIYNDVYGEDGERTLNLHYIAEIVGGEMRPMDDVAGLEWVDINNIPPNLAFQNTKDVLADLKIWYSKDQTKTASN